MGFPIGTRFSADYPFAASITVDNHLDGTTRDASLDIPEDWDEFWDAVADTTNGYDIIVVDPVTNTIVDFQFGSFDYATRDCVIEMDNVTEANSVTHLWLYCGKSTPSDLSTAFTHSAGATAYVEVGSPAQSDLVVVADQKTGRTPPEDKVTKGTGEVLYVWLDVERALARRLRPYNGSKGYESVVAAVFSVQLAGAAQPTMVDAQQTRFVEAGKLVRALVKAGTVDVDYTGVFTVTTNLNRTLDHRFLLQIRNPKES